MRYLAAATATVLVQLLIAPASAETPSAAAPTPPAAAPTPAAAAPKPSPAAATPAAAIDPRIATIKLPGAAAEGVFLDYLAVDDSRHHVWVPAGGTGKVVVIDSRSREVRSVDGLPTTEVERRGQKRRVGPTSATVGDGYVYFGNRADSTVCAVDAATLARGSCVTLPSMPDGLAFVAKTKEVWATTPRDQTISFIDVSKPSEPKLAGTMKLEGDPEGYAVDDARGLFYTNLEDKNKTLRIDVAKRAVTATWQPGCGESGPRGLAFDPGAGTLFVACTDHVESLDPGKDGKVLARLDTGSGVDSIAYHPARHMLYVAAAGAATLTVAEVGKNGELSKSASLSTAQGARNAVVTEDGTVWIADGPAGAILVLPPTGKNP